jgi:hypothetical protein
MQGSKKTQPKHKLNADNLNPDNRNSIETLTKLQTFLTGRGGLVADDVQWLNLEKPDATGLYFCDFFICEMVET